MLLIVRISQEKGKMATPAGFWQQIDKKPGPWLSNFLDFQHFPSPPVGERGFLVAQAFQPVLTQVKACGYIFNLSFEPALQIPCWTLLIQNY